MKNKALVAAVAATAGGVPVADAATYAVSLTEVRQYSNSGTAGSAQNITSSTATWSYDDVTNLVAQTGGTFNARFTTNPATTLYRTSITGLIMGGGGAASASTYVCSEGNFGDNVGASVCGNYNFGANGVNNSTTSWGPGTTFSKTIGGDDNDVGSQQNIDSLDGFNQVSFVGTTLVLANRTCTVCPGTFPADTFNRGQQWTFAVVPIPPTVWLLGTACLGLASRLRRKAST